MNIGKKIIYFNIYITRSCYGTSYGRIHSDEFYSIV